MPFEGGTDRADAADHRRGPADPGLRGQPRRPQAGRRDRVRHHVPRGLPGADAAPASRCTSRSTSRSCARRSCPTPTTRSRSRWATTPTSRRSGPTSRERLGRNALDRARHEFSDKIIEYAVANATIELPDVLIDQEVEVMHDEFRSDARPPGHLGGGVPQGDRPDRGGPPHRVPAARRAAHQGAARALEDRRGRGDRRPRRGHRGPGRARAGALPGTRRPSRYFESERGRNFIRSTLRRTRVGRDARRPLAAAHPEHPALPHLEDDAPSGVDGARGRGGRLDRRHRPGLDPGRQPTASHSRTGTPKLTTTASGWQG